MSAWLKTFLASPANVAGVQKLLVTLGVSIASSMALTGSPRILGFVVAGISFAAGVIDIVRPDLAATVGNLETDAVQTIKDGFAEYASKSPTGATALLSDLAKIGADASPLFTAPVPATPSKG